MSKSKKSRKTEDSSEDSNESSTSEASTSDGSSEEGTHKRSKHRKKSKKVKKHKSNKKKTHNSDSEDDSDSSTAAADAVKVSKKSKKHKKHKKKRSSRHHPHSDDEVRIQEPEKVTYISSGDEAAGKYRQHQKRDKRLDELKRLRDVGGGELEKDVKSKWDSPAEKERRSYINRAGVRDRDDEAKFRDDPYGRGPIEDNDREDKRRPDYRRHDREGPLADEHHRRHVDGRYHEEGLPHRGPDVISRRHEDGRGRTFEGGRGRGNEHYAPGWRERENLPAPISARDTFGAPTNSRYGGGRDGDRPESSRNNYRERSHDRDGDRGGGYERKHFAGDSSRGGRVGGRSDGPHFEQRPSADERESGTAQSRNPFARKPNEIPEFGAAIEADIGEGRRAWRGGNRRGGGDRRDNSGRSQMPNFGSRDNNGGGYRFNDNKRAGSVDRRDDRGRKESRDRSDSHQRRSEKRSQHSDHHGSIKREPVEDVGNGRGRDRERNRDISRPEHSRSRSPDTKAHRFRKHKDGADEDSKKFEWGTGVGGGDDSKDKATSAAVAPPTDKEKPNFGLSGKLTEDTNKVNGVVIKYAEPQEARKPKRRWRLYPFKGEQSLQTLYIHRQSCYLIGRERKICDIPVDHPSCSKQHAVLQYRLVPYTKEDGTKSKRVRPYVLDMESANGTFVNNKKIEPKKYLELIEKDVIKFGFSSREYVLLHENSKDDEEDDDIDLEMEAKIAIVKDEPTAAVAGD